ncbi:MAG: phage BR0599 family protein, partial [bacterium]
NLSGIVRWLRNQSGEVVTRSCGWRRLGFNFGVSAEAGCKVDVAALTFTGAAADSVTSKRIFTTDTGLITSGLGAQYFMDGVLTWITGDNVGSQNEVSAHDADVAGAYTLELYIESAYPIQPGDTFSIEPGCNRLPATCKVKFNNFENFNGADALPDSQTTLGVIS